MSLSRIRLLAIVAALLAGFVGRAAGAVPLEIAPLFSDHMVLQREQPIRIWGTAAEGAVVKATLANNSRQATVKDGAWNLQFPAMPAGGPHELTVASDGRERKLQDILVGDVWLAGGQSNMQLIFQQVPELLARGDEFLDSRVRIFAVNLGISNVPLGTVGAPRPRLTNYGWKSLASKDLQWVSILGYLFASQYEKRTKVPVGVILSSQGSTPIETWMPLAAVRQVETDVKPVAAGAVPQVIEDKAFSKFFRANPCPPAGFYNAMIAPLVRFPIKGVLWYQGENNSGHPMKYASLLQAMIEAWRQAWGIEDLSFVIVQLTSNGKMYDSDKTQEQFAWLREQQQTAVDRTRGAGLAITYDLGEYSDSHPHAKLAVAERMLETYFSFSTGGAKQLGPRLLSSAVEGPRFRLRFQTAGHKLVAAEVVMNKKRGLPPRTDPEAFRAPAGKLTGFEICGPDQRFVEAGATIDGRDVIVASPSVSQPSAVRYAWKDFTLANLFDDRGYPAAPFRTDSFDPPPALRDKARPISPHISP